MRLAPFSKRTSLLPYFTPDSTTFLLSSSIPIYPNDSHRLSRWTSRNRHHSPRSCWSAYPGCERLLFDALTVLVGQQPAEILPPATVWYRSYPRHHKTICYNTYSHFTFDLIEHHCSLPSRWEIDIDSGHARHRPRHHLSERPSTGSFCTFLGAVEFYHQTQLTCRFSGSDFRRSRRFGSFVGEGHQLCSPDQPRILLPAAKLYSPLFIKIHGKNSKFKSAKGVKKREKRSIGKPKTLTKMAAQILAPSAVPDGAAVKVEPQQWKENLSIQQKCPDCKEDPPNIVEEFSSGDMVCASCGLVLGERIIDTRSEWRTFSNDDQGNDDPSRVGEAANPLLSGGAQLQTNISFGDGTKSRELARAQNKVNSNKTDKTLLTAYKEITAFGDSMGIPQMISDTAKHLFKMVSDSGAFKGKNQDTLIAGCIFIACRQCKAPRTFREIFSLTKVSKAEIGRVFKSLDKFFSQQNKEKMASITNGKSNVVVLSLMM